MNKIAFVFPGQGVQKVGMGKDFYENSQLAADLYNQASNMLSLDFRKLCFENNEKLDCTEYTQAALVTTCLAMARCVEQKGIHADVTAGLSLGEYCALAIAGGLRDLDAIKLVRKRGQFMESAVPEGKGAMAAVLGMEREVLEKTISERGNVYVANYNCPGQIVITGEKEAVLLAREDLKKAGAKRVLLLNVSGPFHSPLLAKAKKQMGVLLDDTKFAPLQIPYVTNVTAEYVYDSKNSKQLLADQVCSSVLWQMSIENMIQNGVNIFIEIGPGRTLTGFIKKINKEVKTYNIASWKDMDSVTKELSGEEYGK